MQINQSDLDLKKVAEQAIADFENALQVGSNGADKNLLAAIEILRDYEPSITNAAPDPNELTDLEREIISAWNENLNTHIKAHAQPTKLRDDTLNVYVDTGVWLSEIVHHHKKEILIMLQEAFGKQVIRKVNYGQNDLPSNQTLLRYFIPESLISLSAAPQMPYSFQPERPVSAQDLIRASLKTTPGMHDVVVSFHPEGSSPVAAILKEQEWGNPNLSVSEFGEFEVFAQDDFTCQRCGRKAPEVLLYAGEVKRFAVQDRAYVTICFHCSQAISPAAASIRKTIPGEQEIELRKTQLEFMAKFQNLSDCWSALVPTGSLSEREKPLLCDLISQFKADEIKIGMQIAANLYVESVDGTPTNTSASYAFRRVGGVCHNRQQRKSGP